jgi:hypothetical protein
MGKAIIRQYKPEDREAVRSICYRTGLMGDPIESQYSDFESFADIFSSYYTDQEPENALVAELDGQVVGYILCCLDTRKAPSPLSIALKHSLRRGVCFRPGTARFYFRSAWDTLHDGIMPGPGRPHIDLARYPSHTHNNLLPEGRGAGVGKEFFFQLYDHLKAAGSPGMHGEVFAENHKMCEYGIKVLGYEKLGEPYLVPGMRTASGGRMRVQMFVRDLTGWEIGAWKSKPGARPSAPRA